MSFNTDHSITVFIHRTEQTTKQTSSNKSIQNKKYTTSNKSTPALKKSQGIVGGLKNKVNKLNMVGKVSFGLFAASKTLNTANKMAGVVTNNRYSVTRTGDAMQQVFNPVGFYKRAIKFGMSNHFEIMRQNEKVAYNLKLSGNMLPYRRKDGGNTI